MPPDILNVTRTLSCADGATAHFATTGRGEAVIVWPGTAPELDGTPQTVLTAGTLSEQPCWLEVRPADRLLGDLSLPLPDAIARTVAIQLTDELTALHAAGIVHGAIDRNAAMITPSGHCSWIGAARVEGSRASDIAGLMVLLVELGVRGGLDADPIAIDSIAEQLGAQPVDPDALVALLERLPPPPIDPVVRHQWLRTPVGLMDEVQHELGDDAEGRGLLDRWDPDEDVADLTDDSTESVVMGSHHAQTRQHILSELFTTLDAAIADPQNPDPSFRRVLNTEPLDPIVALNGLPHGHIHNPHSVNERTAEVSSPEVTAPSHAMIDETTGFTGPAPLQQSVVTGLLMAAVLGMVGAAVMLILVWLILGDVF